MPRHARAPACFLRRLILSMSLLLHLPEPAHADTAAAAAAAAQLDRQGRRYYLAVGAVFRDEDRYLAEWLEFHLCVGVEHFFLFNHHSATERHRDILQPYMDAGLVTLDEAVCDLHCQVPTYERCVAEHGEETRWLALIDIDEFLLPSSAGSLPEVLSTFEPFAAVLVHWLVFGSSHHEETPPGLVLEEYTWRAAEASEVVKSVSQPHLISKVGGHNHEYTPPWQAVNGARVVVPFNASAGEAPSTHAPPSLEALRIHHYRSKSRKHSLWRFHRDSSFRLNDFDNEDIFPSSEETQAAWLERWDSNEVMDRAAGRFLPCVREGLSKRTASHSPHSEL